MTIHEIVTKLDQENHRATYGAVADLVGLGAQGVMTNCPRNHLYSWVVAASGPRRGWPTGYASDEIHPVCLQQIYRNADTVISSPEASRRWLNSEGRA